jgi:hypothetical protein
MSISNTRLSKRAQLIRTEAEKSGTAIRAGWITFAFLVARNNLKTMLRDWFKHAMEIKGNF